MRELILPKSYPSFSGLGKSDDLVDLSMHAAIELFSKRRSGGAAGFALRSDNVVMPFNVYRDLPNRSFTLFRMT